MRIEQRFEIYNIQSADYSINQVIKSGWTVKSFFMNSADNPGYVKICVLFERVCEDVVKAEKLA